jgi:hypothetical protein
MKTYLHCLLMLLIALPTPTWCQVVKVLPPVKTTNQETRRSSRHDVEVRVSIELTSVAVSSRSGSVPLRFTVKNTGTAAVGFASYERQNVEIFEADKVAEFTYQNRLFPFPGVGGSGAKELQPGESYSFDLPVPIDLFKMNGVPLIAGFQYGIVLGPNEVFQGEALSEPFLLPALPAPSATPPSATPAGTPPPPKP